MIQEVAGRLIQMRGDRLHRAHAVGEQRDITALESNAAAECAAQPPVEGFGEADAVARLRHLRAARERVAGAVDLFGQRMRFGLLRFAREIRAHRCYVGRGLPRVDIAQRVVLAGLRAGRDGIGEGSRGWRGALLRRRGGGPAAGEGRAGERCAGERCGTLLPVGRCGRAPGCRSPTPNRERVRAGDDGGDVRARRSAGIELLDELGESGDRCPQRLQDRRRAAQGIIEHAVEQVLHGPGELAQIARTDHAAAALQACGTSGAR